MTHNTCCLAYTSRGQRPSVGGAADLRETKINNVILSLSGNNVRASSEGVEGI